MVTTAEASYYCDVFIREKIVNHQKIYNPVKNIIFFLNFIAHKWVSQEHNKHEAAMYKMWKRSNNKNKKKNCSLTIWFIFVCTSLHSLMNVCCYVQCCLWDFVCLKMVMHHTDSTLMQFFAFASFSRVLGKFA